MKKRYLNSHEAVREFRLPILPVTLRAMARRKEIPHTRLGSKILFDRETLRRHLETVSPVQDSEPQPVAESLL